MEETSLLREPLGGTPDAEETAGLVAGEKRKESFDVTLENDGHDNEKIYREIIFVTIAVFSGYAALVVLQQKLLKVFFQNSTPGHDLDVQENQFKHACSFNYVGNLIFRIAHNFVFGCVSPRRRVYISLFSVGTAMFILGFLVICLDIRWIGWIYLAYFLGGMGIGTFESNLLSSITPLGHGTKKWAIIGMPLGFNTIAIFGFVVLELGAPLQSLYAMVCVLVAAGSLIFMTRIPNIPIADNSVTTAEFIENVRQWRSWFPAIKFNAVALMLDMYVVSFCSSGLQYIFNDSKPVTGKVPLFGGDSGLVKHDWFFATVNLFTLAGDSMSRAYVYWADERNPLWYILLSLLGGLCCLSKIGILAPLGMFFVFFANGAVYGTSTRYIDSKVAARFNLVALSIWLFVGDIGSVTGSNSYENIISEFICSEHSTYVCKNS